MRQTEDFNNSVRDARIWLDSDNKDYDTGVDILIISGFKRNLALKLKRVGFQPWSMESLKYSLSELYNINIPIDTVPYSVNKEISNNTIIGRMHFLHNEVIKFKNHIKNAINKRLFRG